MVVVGNRDGFFLLSSVDFIALTDRQNRITIAQRFVCFVYNGFIYCRQLTSILSYMRKEDEFYRRKS